MRILLFAFAMLGLSAASASAERAADPLEARISTEDVSAFFRIYEAENGRPSADALQTYIDQGSVGVRGFIPNRIVSAENLARTVAGEAQIYADARVCAGQLGNVAERVRAAFLALEALYPDATYPQTYILIGANNSGGTASAEALMIGLEVMCRTGGPDPSPLDVRLGHIIAHEMVHSLQRGFADGTLLAQSLNEGAAEFIAELISGRISNIHLTQWTRGREAEIEQRFAREMYGRDISGWLYNGVGAPEAPGDLGYWVGYRIVRAYYERAPDKRRAVQEILKASDARAFLIASGWRPGAED
jgi:hypothetical protein